ncbi:MAG: DUF1684 domain-containing protein [Chitinophagaceae bacterium]
MKQIVLLVTLLSFTYLAAAQTYKDSLELYQKNYVAQHQVVQGRDKEHIHFFPVDSSYHVKAKVEFVDDAPWVAFATSSGARKNYRVYAVLHFILGQEALTLNLYQSQDLLGQEKYRDYLFLPFADATNGHDSYASGRYLELREGDINGKETWIDFNKAYNPYCAYAKLYSCPIPPVENQLMVAIKAGEKMYSKIH